MYLREMGGVELLSREGEIAIAKRIEAGKSVMTESLFQSPITGKKIFEWNDKLNKNEILVREIIDIDSTYMDSENQVDPDTLHKDQSGDEKKDKDKIEKQSKKKTKDNEGENQGKENENEYVEEDEFNVPLAAMEEEIKPQIILTIGKLCKNYSKLFKYQKEQLECALKAKPLSLAKEKGFKKIQNELVEKAKSLQLNQSILEDLVQAHYEESRKVISFEGILMRSAMENKISREEFIKYYVGNEINPNFYSFLSENVTWKKEHDR